MQKQPLEMTTVPMDPEALRIEEGKKTFQKSNSAGELSAVSLALVNMFEDFCLMHVLGLLVAEASTSSPLLQLYAFTAVNI